MILVWGAAERGKSQSIKQLAMTMPFTSFITPWHNAFYDEIIKYPQSDENKRCLEFDDIYESINSDWIKEEMDKIR